MQGRRADIQYQSEMGSNFNVAIGRVGYERHSGLFPKNERLC